MPRLKVKGLHSWCAVAAGSARKKWAGCRGSEVANVDGTSAPLAGWIGLLAHSLTPPRFFAMKRAMKRANLAMKRATKRANLAMKRATKRGWRSLVTACAGPRLTHIDRQRVVLQLPDGPSGCPPEDPA